MLSAIFSCEGLDKLRACLPHIFEERRDTQYRTGNKLSKQKSSQKHLREWVALSFWALQNLSVLSLHQGCKGSNNALIMRKYYLSEYTPKGATYGNTSKRDCFKGYGGSECSWLNNAYRANTVDDENDTDGDCYQCFVLKRLYTNHISL